MFKQKTLIVSIGLALLLVLSSVTGVIAKSELDQIDLSGLTLSEIEALFPMSTEAEAAIVHVVPEVPVIIDGVRYKPGEITLFNGQRLRFVVDTDGVLRAFTTVKGLEQFIAEEFGQPASRGVELLSLAYGRFYEHIYYSGWALWVGPGIGISDLGFFHDKISSVQVDQGITAGVLWEHEYFTGSYFWVSGGSSYPSLVPYGWNDRASSLMVFQ